MCMCVVRVYVCVCRGVTLLLRALNNFFYVFAFLLITDRHTQHHCSGVCVDAVSFVVAFVAISMRINAGAERQLCRMDLARAGGVRRTATQTPLPQTHLGRYGALQRRRARTTRRAALCGAAPRSARANDAPRCVRRLQSRLVCHRAYARPCHSFRLVIGFFL